MAKAQHKGLGSRPSVARGSATQASKTLRKRGCAHWRTEMVPALAACNGLVAWRGGVLDSAARAR